MIDPVGDRRPPVSPQLAWRIAVLGIVAFGLFAVIFFRLWYLQVLSGDQYLAQARSNKVRIERIPAPRGDIVDRSNHILVDNRPSVVVKVRPNTLPESERLAVAHWGKKVIARSRRPKGHQGTVPAVPAIPVELKPLIGRLARVLEMSAHTIQVRLVQGLYLTGYAPVTIKSDVSNTALTEISERSEEFPGVDVERAYLRDYPNNQLAAQVLGYVGQINSTQLKQKPYHGIPQGTIIGQDGLESKYDSFLRGTDGTERFTVDAQGNFKGQTVARAPKPGGNIRLSLSIPLQKAAEQAYQDYAGSLSGAFVAMDPRNGQVLAMGSFPTYDPNVLAKPLTPENFQTIFGSAPGEAGPLFNRAISSQYATGSTFKPVTSLAALTSGVITPTSTVDDPGCITIGHDPTKRCNSGGGHGNGAIDLPRALQISSDVFFYKMGEQLNALPHRPLQTWARRLGLERRSGIDLPGEVKGLVPDAAWRKRVAEKEIAYEKATHRACCLYSDKREWSTGDNVNLAVGQGDLQATPVQMAVLYSTIVNGGKVPVPRLTREIQDDRGIARQRISAGTSRHVDIPEADRRAILDGLHAATSEAGGTSADVFKDWNQSRYPIYGKTGTAEVFSQTLDQSWFVAYSYDNDKANHRPIVVAVTAEKGGFGAHTAAPIAGRILEAWFHRNYPLYAGSNGTK
jgi:penicillin-binding protein 2